jgi:hypothetical protein
MIKSPKSMGKIISAVFFVCLLVLGASIYKDYGVSVDEPAQRLIGATNVNHIAQKWHIDSLAKNETLAQFPKKLDQIIDRDYGIIFEVPAIVMELVFHIKEERKIYFARHLLTFLFFCGGVFAVYKMAARRFSDWRIGLLAATFLILSPRIFADAFYNSKDLVFLSVFAIAMNTAIGFVIKPNWRSALIHGLACAIAIDTRLMAVIIPALTIIIIVIKAMKKEVSLKLLLSYTALFLLSCAIFVVLFWPFLWDAPLRNFAQAFSNMAKFRWAPEFIFQGKIVSAANLPWYYAPVWIGISTPILYLFFFGVGVLKTFFELAKNHWRIWANPNQLQDLIFLGLLMGPVVAIIVFHSTLYNGWRHIYFIYPAFILVATHGLIYLHQQFRHRIIRIILTMAVLVSCSYTAYWMVRHHPLQNIYFNAFAKKWDRQFEVDYWGLANKMALEKILKASNEESLKVWPGRGYQWPGGWQMPYLQNLSILSPEEKRKILSSESHHDAQYVITTLQARKDSNTEAFLTKHQYQLVDQILIDQIPVISIFKYHPDALLPPVQIGEKLNFAQLSPSLEYFTRGWQEPEDWGSWSSGKVAELRFPLASNRPQQVEMIFRALVTSSLPAQRIEVLVNGKLTQVMQYKQAYGNTLVIPVPKEGSEMKISLRLPTAAKPIDLGINKDVRQIAIGLESAQFK